MAPDTPSLGAPVDTTNDPDLEARWQTLVTAVIDAKAAFAAARAELIAAELARGPLPEASDDALQAVADARARYLAAGQAVEAAATAMKEGRL